jgi:MFS family permease
MLILGVGAGLAFNPLLLAAMSDVSQEQSGLASGVVNTTQMLGGSLGLAILASVAASRTDSLLGSGDGPLEALTGGYHIAFIVGAVFAALGALLAAGLVRAAMPQPEVEPQAAAG